MGSYIHIYITDDPDRLIEYLYRWSKQWLVGSGGLGLGSRQFSLL